MSPHAPVEGSRGAGGSLWAPAAGPVARLRRLAARLPVRLLVFHLVLVLVPLAALFVFGINRYLATYERQLLDAQERAMTQQVRLLAAALAERPTLETAEAEPILRGLEQRLTSRLRVYDADAALVADSSRLGPRRDEQAGSVEAAGAATVEPGPEDHWLYRLAVAPVRVWRRVRTPARPTDSVPEPAATSSQPEVADALAGRYGAAIRASAVGPAGEGAGRSIVLHTAVPVRREGRVVGAVQASESTYRILRDLRQVRLAFFQVFLASTAAAIVLSLIVTATIARPVRRLQSEAASLVDRRGRLRGRFSGSRKLDEIGDLARSLEALSRRVEEHVGFIETFAAQVSHEFKNPLAAIRTASEILPESDSPEERRRLLATIEEEVARMERLLSAVREMSWIDSRLDEEPAAPVDLAALLPAVVAGIRARAPEGAAIELALPAGSAGERPGAPGTGVTVRGSADRIVQVVENLVDNALGFAPAGTAVRVALERAGREAVITVSDEGPGIPEEHRERVFDRFFTYRPAEPSAGRHTGLGLSIVRSIAEGYGGGATVNESLGGGAEVAIRLPIDG